MHGCNSSLRTVKKENVVGGDVGCPRVFFLSTPGLLSCSDNKGSNRGCGGCLENQVGETGAGRGGVAVNDKGCTV